LLHQHPVDEDSPHRIKQRLLPQHPVDEDSPHRIKESVDQHSVDEYAPCPLVARRMHNFLQKNHFKIVFRVRVLFVVNPFHLIHLLPNSSVDVHGVTFNMFFSLCFLQFLHATPFLEFFARDVSATTGINFEFCL
jgi:hypothetical protein